MPAAKAGGRSQRRLRSPAADVVGSAFERRLQRDAAATTHHHITGAAGSERRLRDAAVRLLATAVGIGAGADVERAMYERYFYASRRHYRRRVVALCANAKGASALMARGAPAAALAVMPTAMLCAPDAPALVAVQRRLGERRCEQQRQVADERRRATTQGTGLLRCPRCRRHHTDYVLLQTRSSDEGMTAFHACLHCDHRW